MQQTSGETPQDTPAAASAKFSRRRRLIVWLAIGGVAILAGWGYIEFWLSRPIGTGPAGPRVAAEAFEQPWTEQFVLVLGIGDSITDGMGARTPAHGYFERLIDNPADEYPDLQGLCLRTVLPNLEAENLAISGSTSLEHLVVIQERVPTMDEEVLGLVMLTTGGNDLIHSYGRSPPREGAMYGATLVEAEPWIEGFEARLATMIDGLNDRFPGGCHIFLADIYDPTDGVGDAPSVYLPHWPDGLAIHARYNDIIQRCAETRENVHLVPLHKTFLGHGSHCRQFWRSTYRPDDPHYWYFENIEDPNDRGHDAIRRLYLNAVIDVMQPAEANP